MRSTSSRPSSRGGAGERSTVPIPRWEARLDDPDEPLYTMAVVCELLESDPQTIRRLEHRDVASPTRSKGNHRRFSRNEIVTLAAALDLKVDGVPASAVPRLLSLDERVRALEARLDPNGEPQP